MIASKATQAAKATVSRATFKAPVLRSVRARVSTQEDTQTDAAAPPKVDFMPNTQASSGYVEFDTAGQSNMYPVITRAYETGSDQDTLETGNANFAVGVGAGAIAVAVLAVGLAALSQQGGAGAGVTEGLEQFKTLSQYAAAFSAEL